MDRPLADTALPQIEALLLQFNDIQRHRQAEDYSDVDMARATEFITAGMAAIQRIAGARSPYALQVAEAAAIISPYHIRQRIPHVGGALKALRTAIQQGYLDNLQEGIHAGLLADLLDRAQAIIDEGQKEPAMILVGSVLEEHLRLMGAKNGVPLKVLDAKGASHPKTAVALQSDLANRGMLSDIDQKSVTAWLEPYGAALQGEAGGIPAEQVELALQGVRDFITRHPA